MEEKILQVNKLKTFFETDEGTVKSVDRVNIDLRKGEILGLVGESGCGKTMLSLSIMGLVPHPGRIIDGQILFNGKDLRELSPEQMREIRGVGIGMIFQDPLTSLNPVFSIKEQLTRPLKVHFDISDADAEKNAIQMLQKVGVPAPEKRINEYPHQFSGGQRQRIMIAAALALQPEILICDEPTTALDVSIQAQILQLLKDLQEEFGTAMIFISHDLGVVSGIAHRVAVMYSGWIVETASAEKLFKEPRHPYTRSLLSAVPSIRERNVDIISLHGRPPKPGEKLKGCRLFPRCPFKLPELCDRMEPPFVEIYEGHSVRCFLYKK